METYEWQKNEAIVNRMYYTERVVQTTTAGAVTFLGVNQMFISKGYFANACRARFLPTLKWWAILTLPTVFFLQWPITAQERYLQLRKRKAMGKWLYSTFHLELDDNTPEHPNEALKRAAAAAEAAKAGAA